MTKQLIALVSLFSSNCNTSDVGAIDMRVIKNDSKNREKYVYGPKVFWQSYMGGVL